MKAASFRQAKTILYLLNLESIDVYCRNYVRQKKKKLFKYLVRIELS